MAPVAIGQLVTTCHAVGWKSGDLRAAVAIALTENSKLDRLAVSPANTDGTHDYGLFQINSVHKPTTAQKTEVYANVAMAHKIYVDAGKKFTPWATFNDGSYRANLVKAGDAMHAIGGKDYDPPYTSPDGNDKALADSMQPKAKDLPGVAAVMDIPGAIAAAANSATAQLAKMGGNAVAVVVAIALLGLGVAILLGKPALAVAAVTTPVGKVAKLASTAAGTGGAHR